jgi:hypothetical protein
MKDKKALFDEFTLATGRNVLGKERGDACEFGKAEQREKKKSKVVMKDETL